MTASNHLKRFPNARGSTLAYLALRDEKTDQLRRETRGMRRKGWFARLFSAVADALRSWRA